MLHAETSNTLSPLTRLGLTLALGVLGTWWMPFNMRFIPYLDVQNPALPGWLAFAFVGVLLLHRVERVKTPKTLLVFMALILALTYWFLSIYTIDELSGGFPLARFGFIGFWFWMAGVMLYGRPAYHGGIGSWIAAWAASGLRGAALAVVSPLLLFASRIQGMVRSQVGFALVSLLFLIFLFALAAGSEVTQICDDYYYRYVLPFFRNCASFKIWAWMGCALLYLLSPWPDESPWKAREHLTRVDKSRALAPLVVLAVALALLAYFNLRRFQSTVSWALLIVYVAGLDIALLLVLGPWPRWPRIPKFREPPAEAKIHPLFTILLLTMAAVPIYLFTRHAMFNLLTGNLFEMKFDHRWVGWVLDQSTIQCGYWRFTLLTAMVMSYVAWVRWLSDRTTRWGYWTFSSLVLALFFFLLSLLTCIFYDMLVYTVTMGLTPLRIYGLDYGAACYAVVFFYVKWAIKFPNGKEASIHSIEQG